MTSGGTSKPVSDALAHAVYAIWLWNDHDLTDALAKVAEHRGVRADVREAARASLHDAERAYVAEVLTATFSEWAKAERSAG
jgi:hypothetical protein